MPLHTFRRCTLIFNQSRSFHLSPSIPHIPASCTQTTFFLGYRCFSEVRPASLVVQGISLTPSSAEPGTMITRPLRGGEATTPQLHNHSTIDAALPILPCLSTLSPRRAPSGSCAFMRKATVFSAMAYTQHGCKYDILTLTYASLPSRRPENISVIFVS